MSQAHIQQFYQKAANDPILLGEMLKSSVRAGTFAPEDFIRVAVAKGKELGYQFTEEEAASWIKSSQQLRANGELDDTQLESVAGGKSAKQFFNDAGKDEKAFYSQFASDGKKAGNWFASW